MVLFYSMMMHRILVLNSKLFYYNVYFVVLVWLVHIHMINFARIMYEYTYVYVTQTPLYMYLTYMNIHLVCMNGKKNGNITM